MERGGGVCGVEKGVSVCGGKGGKKGWGEKRCSGVVRERGEMLNGVKYKDIMISVVVRRGRILVLLRSLLGGSSFENKL